MVKNKKTFYAKSIYVGDDDSGIDKELNKLAKEDPNIPDSDKRRSSMVSYITILLWKSYIKKRKREDESDTN